MSLVAVRAVAYLASQQQADGSFLSILSRTRVPFKPYATVENTFTNALLLGAISGTATARAMPVRRRLAQWLLEQKSGAWSYNYWPAGSNMAAEHPYPDDLDVTACAMAALHAHDPTLLSADVQAHLAKLLIATEQAVGGPYRTWLVPPSADHVWMDTDLAVNSNVAYLINRLAEPLPSLQKLLETAILQKNFSSPYYPSEYPVLYFIARAYTGAQRPELISHIQSLRHTDGHWHTPLQTALAITALRRAGYTGSLRSAIRFLRQTQQGNGSWPAEMICLNLGTAHDTSYLGAASLTTAFVLEALQAEPLTGATKHSTAEKEVNVEATTCSQQILQRVHADSLQLDAALRREYIQLLSVIQHGRSITEIVLLPYSFGATLLPLLEASVKDTLAVQLGCATLYGWMAYTVYDDFLDGEGKVRQLSVANVALRNSFAIFSAAVQDPAWKPLVAQYFARIDGANAWEVAYARATTTGSQLLITSLPKYGNLHRLADRSAGHALGPLGMAMAAGVGPDAAAFQLLHKSLHHYLIARQLNDDMHDWEEDIQAGRLTYVVTEILRDMQVSAGTYNLEQLITAMRLPFWRTTLPRLCNTMQRHAQTARRTLDKSQLVHKQNILYALLDEIETTAQHTLNEQRHAATFLAAYSKKTLANINHVDANHKHDIPLQ